MVARNPPRCAFASASEHSLHCGLTGIWLDKPAPKPLVGASWQLSSYVELDVMPADLLTVFRETPVVRQKRLLPLSGSLDVRIWAPSGELTAVPEPRLSAS